MVRIFSVPFNKPLPPPKSWRFSSMFSLKGFIVLPTYLKNIDYLCSSLFLHHHHHPIPITFYEEFWSQKPKFLQSFFFAALNNKQTHYFSIDLGLGTWFIGFGKIWAITLSNIVSDLLFSLLLLRLIICMLDIFWLCLIYLLNYLFFLSMH